jgi:hypothetical protein
MGIRNKKKPKKLDLLEMSNSERMRLMKEVGETLRQKIIEAKLWHSLLETEDLTVNGNIVFKENPQLSALNFKNRI